MEDMIGSISNRSLSNNWITESLDNQVIKTILIGAEVIRKLETNLNIVVTCSKNTHCYSITILLYMLYSICFN